MLFFIVEWDLGEIEAKETEVLNLLVGREYYVAESSPDNVTKKNVMEI